MAEEKKLTGNFKYWTVNQTQLAGFLGVTPARITQLLKEGVFRKIKSGSLPLQENIFAYFNYKNNNAETPIDYKAEKARHEKYKADLKEIEIQKQRGELIEYEVAASVISEVIVNFRTKIMGVPNKLSPQLEGRTPLEIKEKLNSELEEILTELAEELEASDFDGEKRRAEKSDSVSSETG